MKNSAPMKAGGAYNSCDLEFIKGIPGCISGALSFDNSEVKNVHD